MTYVPLSQRDKRWARLHLGYSTASAGSTIGAYGCAVTALGIALNRWRNVDLYTPDFVNCMMVTHSAYIVGSSNNLVDWPELHNVFPGLTHQGRIDCPNKPAPLEEVNSLLGKDWPVMVYVKPAPNLQHFVLIVGFDQVKSGYLIADPFYGDVAALCPRYGRTPTQAICGIIKLGYGR